MIGLASKARAVAALIGVSFVAVSVSANPPSADDVRKQQQDILERHGVAAKPLTPAMKEQLKRHGRLSPDVPPEAMKQYTDQRGLIPDGKEPRAVQSPARARSVVYPLSEDPILIIGVGAPLSSGKLAIGEEMPLVTRSVVHTKSPTQVIERLGQGEALHPAGLTIESGILQNPERSPLRVVYLAGQEVHAIDLDPGDGILVGLPELLVDRGSHEWLCQCTCTAIAGEGPPSGKVTYPTSGTGEDTCPERNGDTCYFWHETTTGFELLEGTLSGCKRVLFPAPPGG